MTAHDSRHDRMFARGYVKLDRAVLSRDTGERLADAHAGVATEDCSERAEGLRLAANLCVSSNHAVSIPMPVVPGFLPGDLAGDPPGGARVQVALLEVNAPVAA